MPFLPYLLGAVGLTVVLVLSHIARPVRYWGCRAMRWLGLELPCPLYCSMCTGVWVGSAAGTVRLLNDHGAQIVYLEPIGFSVDVLAMGFATSVVSFVVTTWLRSHGEYTEPHHDERKR